MSALVNNLDAIIVNSFDYHGHWDGKTGHIAPLFTQSEDEFDYFNVNASMRYWIEKGAPPSKLIMGIPLYGQSFTLSNKEDNGLGAKSIGPGKAGEFTKSAGFLAFYEV